MYREQRWEVKELNSVFVCKFKNLCVARRALECGSIIFRSIQDYSKSPFILTMDPRWPWHCPRSPARAKHSITQTRIRETGKHPNSRLKLKPEYDPDQTSNLLQAFVCKTNIYSISSARDGHVLCTVTACEVYMCTGCTHYYGREIPTPGRLRPELPVPGSAWVCEMRYKLLTFKRFYGYTLHMKGLPNQSVHVKMSQVRGSAHWDIVYRQLGSIKRT